MNKFRTHREGKPWYKESMRALHRANILKAYNNIKRPRGYFKNNEEGC